MCVTDFQCYGVGLGDTNPRPVGHRHLSTVSYKWIIYSKLFPPELCLSGSPRHSLGSLAYLIEWTRCNLGQQGVSSASDILLDRTQTCALQGLTNGGHHPDTILESGSKISDLPGHPMVEALEG